MKTLKNGSRSFEVEFLQRLLNKAADRDGARGVRLLEDGIFGPKTEMALRAFQGRHRPLVINGIAGSQTWKELGLRFEKEHAKVILFGQPSDHSCWAAAATMILGNESVGPGGARLAPSGGLPVNIENYRAFADSLGWRMLGSSPSVMEMVNLIQSTPAWISGGGTGWAHAVVVSGVYSDGDGSGTGTMFRIHDPWPMGKGMIYGTFAVPFTMLAADSKTRVNTSLDFVLVPR